MGSTSEIIRKSFFLERMGNKEHYKILKFSNKKKLQLGRESSNRIDITLSKAIVSKIHCLIDFQDCRMFVTDLNSRNGTYINNKRIQNRTEVFENDIIGIGFNPSKDSELAESEKLVFKVKTMETEVETINLDSSDDESMTVSNNTISNTCSFVNESEVVYDDNYFLNFNPNYSNLTLKPECFVKLEKLSDSEFSKYLGKDEDEVEEPTKPNENELFVSEHAAMNSSEKKGELFESDETFQLVEVSIKIKKLSKEDILSMKRNIKEEFTKSRSSDKQQQKFKEESPKTSRYKLIDSESDSDSSEASINKRFKRINSNHKNIFKKKNNNFYVNKKMLNERREKLKQIAEESSNKKTENGETIEATKRSAPKPKIKITENNRGSFLVDMNMNPIKIQKKITKPVEITKKPPEQKEKKNIKAHVSTVSEFCAKYFGEPSVPAQDSKSLNFYTPIPSQQNNEVTSNNPKLGTNFIKKKKVTFNDVPEIREFEKEILPEQQLQLKDKIEENVVRKLLHINPLWLDKDRSNNYSDEFKTTMQLMNLDDESVDQCKTYIEIEFLKKIFIALHENDKWSHVTVDEVLHVVSDEIMIYCSAGDVPLCEVGLLMKVQFNDPVKCELHEVFGYLNEHTKNKIAITVYSDNIKLLSDVSVIKTQTIINVSTTINEMHDYISSTEHLPLPVTSNFIPAWLEEVQNEVLKKITH
ncbi:CLUMA_CG014060, isoform A [Clunio marinus]|uniref:CLUMA_CG014060, isoform A n=1 Tax=Clunio marinus TaxID=568069 RepID=A0A1J1IKV8_9DIPT|nr:CLUMA_CG014060, isoform A [Clunio marinus]